VRAGRSGIAGRAGRLKSGLRVDGANSALAWEDESEGPASLTRGAYSDPPSFRRRGRRTGTFYVLSCCEPPFNVGAVHTDPRCCLIDEHAVTAKRPAEVRVATPDEVARQPSCEVCEARPLEFGLSATCMGSCPQLPECACSGGSPIDSASPRGPAGTSVGDAVRQERRTRSSA
jgi:hypothetical protein